MSKGTRREREFIQLLQAAGMATYRPATVQYGENDIFGLFDVLAVSPAHENVYAVQVKSNAASGINAWKRHTALFRRLGWITMYAVPVDSQGWRLIVCIDDDRRDVVDERHDDCNMGENVINWFTAS